MLKLSIVLIALTSCLSSCQDNPAVGDYFDREDFIEYIANGDGTMTDGVETLSSENAVCMRALPAARAKKYYSDKETRLYKCLKYKKSCK